MDLISRQAAIDAVMGVAYWERDGMYVQMDVMKAIENVPSAQPNQTDCGYCQEDSDGFVYVIEKNGHAVIHGNKLMLAAKGWRGEVEIKYCPMCGRRLER